MEKILKVHKKKHAFAMLDRLDKMRNDESRSNFKVKVGRQTILAQRDILIAASDYFDAMLSHDTKENQLGEVEMMDVDLECVKTCINFIYGREILVPSEKYEDLMFVAHMMQLKILCEAIEELMAESLNLKSFFKLKKISDLFQCPLLRQKCIKFAEKNFHAISKEKEFNEIDKQYLLSLIESKNIRISGLEKLEIFLQWVKNKSSRTSELPNLLNRVDLEKIPIGHRCYFIENEQLLSEDLECFRKFSISIMNSNKIPTSKPNTKQRILIFDHDFENLRVFNPQTNQVNEKTQDICAFQDSYAVRMLKNQIYILGGDKSVHRLKYSEEASSWERMADMIFDHGMRPPVVFVSSHIYVIGGGGMETSAVEKYDPSRNEWKEFCEKSKPSDGSPVAAIEQCIYSLGGRIEGQASNEVEKLDVMKSEWISLAPMNEPRVDAAATEWKGYIVVAGGYDTKAKFLRSVEYYDIFMNQWTMLSRMTMNRWVFKLVLVDEIIFALGGSDPFGANSSIDKYDEHNKKWVIVDLPGGTYLSVNKTIPIEAKNR